jgi:hypothetical protein
MKVIEWLMIVDHVMLVGKNMEKPSNFSNVFFTFCLHQLILLNK